jgi:hypothetical protein
MDHLKKEDEQEKVFEREKNMKYEILFNKKISFFFFLVFVEKIV